MRRSNEMNKSIRGRYCIRVGTMEEGISDNRGCLWCESRALSRDSGNFMPTIRQHRNETPPHITRSTGHKNCMRHLCRIDGEASCREPAVVARPPRPPPDGLIWLWALRHFRLQLNSPVAGKVRRHINLGRIRLKSFGRDLQLESAKARVREIEESVLIGLR